MTTNLSRYINKVSILLCLIARSSATYENCISEKIHRFLCHLQKLTIFYERRRLAGNPAVSDALMFRCGKPELSTLTNEGLRKWATTL